MQLIIHQSPDHVVQIGQLLYVGDAGYTVETIEPVRHEGQFVDFGGRVEWCVVEVTVIRLPSEADG